MQGVSMLIVIGLLQQCIKLVHAKPLHILLTVMDDLGWNDLGFRNSSSIRTPVIDALASQGVMLQNYYVMSSCAPTRSTIMTGRHVTRTGIYTPFAGNQPEGVPLKEKILPQVLKEKGYATHMVGKWHLRFFKKEYTPTFRGFDTFYGFYGWGEDYFSHLSSYPLPSGKSAMGYDFRDESSPNCGPECSVVDRNASGSYSTKLFAARAVKIIESHNPEQPLFLYLPWQAVHAPRGVPEAYARPYIKSPRNADFCGMVAAADEGLGNVTSALKSHDMLDNTVIIFTTDNGGPVDTGIDVKNGDATISSLAGAGISMTLPLDGHDQWPYLQSGGSPYKSLFLGCQQSHSLSKPRCAMRQGPWKLIVGDPAYPCGWSGRFPAGEAPVEELYGFGSGTVCGFNDSSVLLYNVRADPGEHQEVSQHNEQVVKNMLLEFAPWNMSKVPYDYALDKFSPKGEPIDGVWGPWVASELDMAQLI